MSAFQQCNDRLGHASRKIRIGNRVALLALLLTWAIGCGGGDSNSTPTSPTPTAEPTPTVSSLTVNGPGCASGACPGTAGQTLQLAATAQMSNNTTQSVTGQTQWTSTNTNAATVNASGLVSLRAAGESDILGSYQGRSSGVTVRVTPAGPRTTFGAGQYFVNRDIASGRFFADPRSGCYWERLRGLGGTVGEIIANDFVGFDAGQLIVDIASGDLAFSTDADCDTWFKDSPRRGFQSTVTPGTWLVGAQIAPGTYRINAGSGCYWERLRNFSGDLNGIIANNFLSAGGPVLVTIQASDVGFNADGDCGPTWSPAQALTPADESRAIAAESISAIEKNREMNRRQQGTAGRLSSR